MSNFLAERTYYNSGDQMESFGLFSSREKAFEFIKQHIRTHTYESIIEEKWPELDTYGQTARDKLEEFLNTLDINELSSFIIDENEDDAFYYYINEMEVK